MSFSNTSSTIGNLFGANNNNSVTTTTTTAGGPAEIIPQQRPSTNHHHYHHTDGVTQISGARPNQKRQPHGGVKSHKLLDKASFQNLFVARLPRALTSNDTLLELFAHYHPVSATIMMNVETGQSKGFGFVTFETEAEGQLAFENLNNRKLRVTVAGDHNSTAADGKIVFFTPEIKPSTFNGHRIVVESPHVYIRNLPLALLFEEEETTSGVGVASFSTLVDFFSRFGEVQLMEFHGGQSLEDIVQTQQRGSVAPPVLVSFNSKEQASAAVSACHGKTLFPEHLTPALMAKFADMTTVKSINRHHKDTRARTTTTTTSTGMVRHRSSGNNSSFDGSSSSAGGVEETFPFPSGPMLRSHQSSAPQVLQSIVPPLQRNFSEGSLPSPVAGASSSATASGLPPHPHQLRRPSPPTEYWTPVVSTLLGGAGSSNQSGVVGSGTTRSSQVASSSSSAAAESRRGSNSGAGSSYHSQHLLHLSTSQPAPPLYRNDPYNLSGYVMVTSSSSSSSSSSSFVVQE